MSELPSIDWYRNPGLVGPTPLTITDEGRVYGHVATWGTAHLSFPGQRVTPPRSRSGYSWFHTGAAMVAGDTGAATEISVGRLIMGCPHAGMSLGHKDAHDFYADSGAVFATVNAHEDQWGIAVAGSIEPGLDELALRRARACGLSADWRNIGGHLEMVGVISVGVQGFPIPRARVASGAPMALVAAGMVRVERGRVAFARRVDSTWRPSVRAGEFTAGSSGARVVIDGDGNMAVFNAGGKQTWPSPAEFADQIAARLDERRRDGELAAQQEALLAELDETPAQFVSLLSELDDTPSQFAAALAAFEVGDVDPKGPMI